MNQALLLVVSCDFHAWGLFPFVLCNFWLWTHFLKLQILSKNFQVFFLAMFILQFVAPNLCICGQSCSYKVSWKFYCFFWLLLAPPRPKAKMAFFFVIFRGWVGFILDHLFSQGITYMTPGLMQGGLTLQLIWDTWRSIDVASIGSGGHSYLALVSYFKFCLLFSWKLISLF